MSERFTPTDHERNTVLWTRLMDHLTTRLETLRRQNDGALDETQTAALRGRIQEIKALMALDKPITLNE